MTGINDLYDDTSSESLMTQEETVETPLDYLEPPQNLSTEEYEEGGSEDDLINSLLQKLGISDPNKIKFLGEDGTIEERPWEDLTYEELVNILSGNNEPPVQVPADSDLDDDEIDLINAVRQANITPEQYLQQVKDLAVQEYLNLNGNVQPTYTIDDYTDDELFVYDLQSRSPELTEDEILQTLEQAKANEELYAKRVSGIRNEYKKLEDNKRQQDTLIAQLEQQEQYNQYANTIWQGIAELNDIADTFELENEDKDMLAQFILGRDQAGISYLGKALNDPQTLIEMSWFALKGREALDSLNEYYKELITKARESGYAKGLEDGKNGKKTTNKVVTKPRKTLAPKQATTVGDLY